MDIEQEIQAKGLTAPRITPADIEANIASEHYFTAADGVLHDNAVQIYHDGSDFDGDKPLNLLTFCVLVLRNGHRIVGVNEGPVSAENFDAELGRKLARQKAVDQLWPLLGFRLRDKLAATPNDFRDRVRAEKQDLDEKIARLSSFMESDKFLELSAVQQSDLHSQRVAMTSYSDVLGQRIAAFGLGQPA